MKSRLIAHASVGRVLLLAAKPFAVFLVAVLLMPLEQIVTFNINGTVTIARVAGILAFVAWMLRRLVLRQGQRFGDLMRAHRPMVLSISGLILAGMLSGLASSDIQDYTQALLSLLQLVALCALTLDYADSEEHCLLILGAYLLGTFALGIAGVAETLANASTVDYRARGFFDNPNQFAVMLLPAVPLGFWRLRHPTWSRLRPVLLGLGCVALVGIGLSLSRAAWLALLAAGASVAILGRRHSHQAHVGLVLLGTLLVVWLFLPRLATIPEKIDFNSADFDYSHIVNYAVGFRMWLKSPIIGVGLGNYRASYASDASLAAYSRFLSVDLLAPHSLYLNVLSELGLCGMVSLLLLLWTSTCRAIGVLLRRNSPQTPANSLLVPIVSVLLSLLVFGVFHDLLYLKVFWLLLGLQASLLTLSTDEAQGQDSAHRRLHAHAGQRP